MKNQPNHKHGGQTAAIERKNPQFRTGTKSFAHRYERRKVREQLRHFDWALTGED